MGTLRSFPYDDPNYVVVRQFDAGNADANASTTAFAKFRSRVAVVVTGITAVCTSAHSAAKVIFTVTRGGSANTTFTIVSATSAGAMTVAAVAITLLSAGDQLAITQSEGGGETHILYEYQVLPEQTLYTRV